MSLSVSAGKLPCERVLSSAEPRFYAYQAPRLVRGLEPSESRFVVALAPLVLLLGLELLVGHGLDSPRFWWLSLLAAEIAAILILPRLIWEQAVSASIQLDLLLEDGEREQMAHWLEGKLDPFGHLALCLLGAAGGVIGTALAAPHVRHSFDLVYYAAAALLGFLATDVVRWVWRAPMVLVRLRKCQRLSVNQLAPVDTPSIQAMSALSVRAARAGGVGIFLFAAPLIWIVTTSKGGSSQTTIGLLCIPPLLVAFATEAYLAFAPQIWLSQLVSSQLARIKAEIAEPFTRTEVDVDELLRDWDNRGRLFAAVSSAPTQTRDRVTLARDAGKVLLAVSPYAIAAASKLLHLSWLRTK
jgi:hypothetical protein